jgi:hypothetical protein
MKAARWALFLAVAALGVPAAWASKPEFPEWVTQAAAAQPHLTAGDHPKAVILLEDTLLTVQADGQITERYRKVVKILQPGGRDYAHPVAWFNKDHKLRSFHIWSIGPDGHQYTLNKKDIYELGAQEWGILYNDARYKSADVPGFDPGGVVAYEYTEQYPAYSEDEPWEFQHSIPTVKSVFEIDLPPGWNHCALWHKYESVQPVEAAPNHFRWELSNIAGIDLDSVVMAPAEQALAGRMEVYFSANPLPQGQQEVPQLWTRIGEWYTQLASPKSEGPADIATASRALVGPSDNFLEKIQKVAAFMQQQIRYVGIEIGIGGWIPHTAEAVYRNRYGDCKDKATLMIAMLDAVGVRAIWVMVDTDRGVVDPKVPSRMADHMIVAIQIPAGYQNPALQAVVTAENGQRYLIFDPTNEYVPIGLLPPYLQGSTGLLMAGANSEAIPLPVLSPGSDTLDRTATFTLGADGSLTGDVVVKRQGASSWETRYNYAMKSEKQKREGLENSLRSDFSAFQVNGAKFVDPGSLDQQIVLSYDVTASAYAKHAGNMLLVRPRVLGSDAVLLPDGPRKYPVEFSGARDWRDTYDVKIPAGYKVDELPDPVNLDTDFASYHSQVKVTGGVLRYSREYKVKKLEISAADCKEFRKFESEIYTDENRDAVLKKVNLGG